MKNGRILAAATAKKHPRPMDCIGLALSVLLFCNGCMTQFHSSSFDVKPKPASSVSATNFRVRAVSDDEHDHEFESHLKTELEKLEQKQDPSLPAVPYSVALRYLGHEETSDSTKMLTGLLFVCSCFVLPHWDTTTHRWEVSTTLPGETGSFRGERSSTDVISWFMLPLGIRDFFSPGGSGSGTPSLSESMAKAIFDSLTRARYDKALQAMEKDAKQRLQGGKKLSDTDERLLANDHSSEALVAWAKHPKNTQNGLAALRQVEDPEALADIALHASLPEIRQAAAERVSGLSELRFAELAVSSADDFVADTFVGRISDDTLLHRIVRTPAASKTTKMAAIWKIRQESVLSAIAKSPDGQPDLQELAVGRIGAEPVLADVASHAPNAKVRLAAIEKIGDPALLLVSVTKDQDQENRRAALSRIDAPKVLAAVVRKSGDAEIRLQAIKKINDPAVLQESVAGDADEAVRLAALERMTDQDVFGRVAETDSSPKVRAAAIAKLADPAMLAQIAKDSAHEENRLAALAKITDDTVVCDIAQADPSAAVRAAAAAKTGNQQALARSARQDDVAEVRKTAVAQIDDPALLAALAKQDADANVRRTALARVTDQSALAAVAKADPDAENRKMAVQRLDDESVLRDIALTDRDQDVRAAALQKLPESSRKAILGSLARKALARGKQAKEDGLVDFCGFYVGMPLADANILKAYYGLQDGELTFDTIPSTTTIEAINISLAGIRRITQGGNSFDELHGAVAARIGYMEPQFHERKVLFGEPEVVVYYEYKTINGNRAILCDTGTLSGISGLVILGGGHIGKLRQKIESESRGGKKSKHRN